MPDEADSIAAIRAGYEAGCTYFDTAESYGKEIFHIGHNEELLGRALGTHREEIVIGSKFHMNWADVKHSKTLYDAIRVRLDRTLKRLGTDYLDLYYMHRLNVDVAVEDIAGVMGQFIEEGLIRGWGMSQVSVNAIRDAHSITPLTAVQDAYSMAQRLCEDELIPYCAQENIGFVAFSPITSYYLDDTKPKGSNSPNPAERAAAKRAIHRWTINHRLMRIIERLARENQATNAQISLAWMLNKYPNLVPIPGSKHPERVYENLEAADIILSEPEVAELDDMLAYCARHDPEVNKLVEKHKPKPYKRTMPKAEPVQLHKGPSAQMLASQILGQGCKPKAPAQTVPAAVAQAAQAAQAKQEPQELQTEQTQQPSDKQK
ncbi:aldo/keto reductase [Bombiscardovia apis]|uniref:Aldo/keto reductase n=1 Tax=Bombiscardovia apis TaxID=2932182 RepID=A0ABM8BAU9_9BIFI|nr:aldo/keto reductase [Bombiscardovia apis]